MCPSLESRFDLDANNNGRWRTESRKGASVYDKSFLGYRVWFINVKVYSQAKIISNMLHSIHFSRHLAVPEILPQYTFLNPRDPCRPSSSHLIRAGPIIHHIGQFPEEKGMSLSTAYDAIPILWSGLKVAGCRHESSPQLRWKISPADNRI